MGELVFEEAEEAVLGVDGLEVGMVVADDGFDSVLVVFGWVLLLLSSSVVCMTKERVFV
jgi:hypothetical protein